MVTPLDGQLGIDAGSVLKLVDGIVENMSIPFILGTTGEAASMSENLKESLARTVIRAVNGRSPVFAGISSNSLETSVNLARKYADLGIDAAVATLPSYYPMDEDQIFVYLESLADLVPVPLILYNMPATVGHSIPLEVIDRLSHHPNVAGLKDSERNTERLDHSLKLWSDRKDFSYLLGWAHMSAYAVSNGADGIVPSTANLVPELYLDLYLSALQDQVDKAEMLQERTDKISLLYQKERKLNGSLPALKALLSLRGLCGPNVLPPLYRMKTSEEQAYFKEMEKELKQLGI
jgi:4-hydroxy-tetrahydrodipicolinate synthase